MQLAEVSDQETGWPSVTDCDGLKWSGLACAAGAPVKIEMAEYQPGVFHRRPPPACWNAVDGDVGSQSTVSNDMILGLMWCQWRRADGAPLARLADYAEKRDWFVGEPVDRVGEVILKPNQVGLLGRMLYVLTEGRDDRYYRRLFRFYQPVQEDFERHLQAMGIVLQGEVTAALEAKSMDATVETGDGKSLGLLEINGEMLARLRELVDAEPENPGYAVALGVYTGDMERALDLLLSDATPVPTYVRSKGGHADEAYALAEWLFWAGVALKHLE